MMQRTLAALAILGFGTAVPAGEILAPDAVRIGEDKTIETALTDEPGDGYRGIQIFIDQERGNCVACHFNADVEGTGLKGNVGPALSLVGDRNPTEKLRAILVNAPAVFGEDTAMPAFYVDDGSGGTLLSAQEVEDVIAYLHELQLYAE